MSEILLPPWVLPQSETSDLLDVTTQVFRPGYAPGAAQRALYVEPRLQVKQGFKSLRSFERGAMLSALSRAQGKGNTIRAVVGYKNRGSFPVTELVTNSTFDNGLTGVFSDANQNYLLVAQDHGVRATRQGGGGALAVIQSFLETVNVPYVLRAYVVRGKGDIPVNAYDVSEGIVSPSAIDGLLQCSFVGTGTTSSSFAVIDGTVAVYYPGDNFDVKFMSAARCALVDNGPNAAVNSDNPLGSGWATSALTPLGSSIVDPQGTFNSFSLTETSVTSAHYVGQSTAVPGIGGYYTVSAWVYPGSRTWCWLQMSDGVQPVVAYFNISAGTLGTLNVSGTWSAGKASIQRYASGWCRISFTAYKGSAQTVVALYLGSASGNGIQSFAGNNTTTSMYMYRFGYAASGTAVRPRQTTTANPTGVQQTGNALHLKGLPQSTSGLLLEGDLFEINGELKTCAAALDSDAAGCGYVTFNPALFRSPADNDPVIISRPMGKFILADNASWDNQFGVYADIDVSLEAIVE